ncbi:MAG: hypothetical protein OXR73_09035 [Myxococcales bacterium]|nr:hypothetical protein [Myxococcales bacterium]
MSPIMGTHVRRPEHVGRAAMCVAAAAAGVGDPNDAPAAAARENPQLHPGEQAGSRTFAAYPTGP